MNKLGIKLYGNNVYEIDGIYYFVNSINHQMYSTESIYKFRLINQKHYCFQLRIKNK